LAHWMMWKRSEVPRGQVADHAPDLLAPLPAQGLEELGQGLLALSVAHPDHPSADQVRHDGEVDPAPRARHFVHTDPPQAVQARGVPTERHPHRLPVHLCHSVPGEAGHLGHALDGEPRAEGRQPLEKPARHPVPWGLPEEGLHSNPPQHRTRMGVIST
jgi:hypothetical protein